MNNSRLIVENYHISLEDNVDNTQILREREAKVVKIIEAIRAVEQSNEWSTLKSEVFDGLTNMLSKELMIEAKKESPDTLKLNRLSGQLKWAERFSDLSRLEEIFRQELSNVRKNLYGKTKE